MMVPISEYTASNKGLQDLFIWDVRQFQYQQISTGKEPDEAQFLSSRQTRDWPGSRYKIETKAVQSRRSSADGKPEKIQKRNLEDQLRRAVTRVRKKMKN